MIPLNILRSALAASTLVLGVIPTMALAQTAYLEITLNIATPDRTAAAGVYTKYKQPFLSTVKGAQSKQLLIRDEDVQVLHGFDNVADANAYLASDLFQNDVVKELKPLLKSAPEVRVYLGD
jgi:hypothetical protein